MSLREQLAKRLWEDRRMPGAWPSGVINPSELELARYEEAMYDAREFADEIIGMFKEAGWTVR